MEGIVKTLGSLFFFHSPDTTPDLYKQCSFFHIFPATLPEEQIPCHFEIKMKERPSGFTPLAKVVTGFWGMMFSCLIVHAV